MVVCGCDDCIVPIELYSINPIPAPGIVVGAVHGRQGTRAAARGAPGVAW